MHAPGRSLRQRVLAGETLFGAFVGLASAPAAEIVGRAGLDWAIVDLEHGAGSEPDLLPAILALAATPTAPLVRPQSGERLRIGRALDLGATGVMVPRLETPEEVREVVSYLRFPPAGVRGIALMTRGAGLGEVRHSEIAGLNEAVLGVFQVESPLAVRNADEIAAIDGVDVLFVGPADLSHSLGVPGRFEEPTFRDALAAVVAAAGRHGKAAGILLRTTAEIETYLGLGFRFVGLGSDSVWVADGARAAVAVAHGLRDGRAVRG